MRQTILILVILALISGCGSADTKSAAPSRGATAKALAGSPAPLAALHREAGQLLEGGRERFRARLSGLHGHPVVVNKWASWCGPCRAEFPYFQKQSVKTGRRVAFLGVNANDEDAAAKRFLGKFPVSYPSYKDPKLEVSAVFNAVQAFPTTAFYGSDGKLAYLRQGTYPSERKLAADIERYAR